MSHELHECHTICVTFYVLQCLVCRVAATLPIAKMLLHATIQIYESRTIYETWNIWVTHYVRGAPARRDSWCKWVTDLMGCVPIGYIRHDFYESQTKCVLPTKPEACLWGMSMSNTQWVTSHISHALFESRTTWVTNHMSHALDESRTTWVTHYLTHERESSRTMGHESRVSN